MVEQAGHGRPLGTFFNLLVQLLCHDNFDAAKKRYERPAHEGGRAVRGHSYFSVEVSRSRKIPRRANDSSHFACVLRSWYKHTQISMVHDCCVACGKQLFVA